MPGQFLILLAMLLFASVVEEEPSWQAKKGPLMTRWAAEVRVDRVHPEYPRPQMVRELWQNLNGLWQFEKAEADEAPPLGRDLKDRILVPFPPESALSGVMERVERVWYRRTFGVDAWLRRAQSVLLHFGAVDWACTVWINGKEVGRHQGGYDPFSFDITSALKPYGEQEIVVGVFDPTDQGPQPRGKQVSQPEGIWYTPTTGIWQTVWLEPVSPEVRIENLRITPDLDQGGVRFQVAGLGINDVLTLRVTAMGDERSVTARGPAHEPLFLPLAKPRLWTPDDPYLYPALVELVDEQQVVDRVETYFGMRKVALGKDASGITRIFLNNEPLFMAGPLDQGFWPDGLYTAPTDEALRFDIEVTKRLGFNMARKHVKVEPARWYYWADRLGLLVWQDMPNGNNGEGAGESFEAELRSMVDAYHNHPCIVMWVIFNEGWGQYDTPRITDWLEAYDPTRLVNSASGWHDRGVGQVNDLHAYPGPVSPEPESDRAAVLGEFGGLGLVVSGHTWQDKKNWGYRNLENAEALNSRYGSLIENVRGLTALPGLCAAVYTQTTDVEIEVNGLMTYDRAVLKVDAEKMAAANRSLYEAPPTIKTVLPSSRGEAQTWRYCFTDPGPDWFREDYADDAWPSGPGGFGTEGTPGARVRTEWTGTDIWLRREIQLPEMSQGKCMLYMHHDEDARVFINGVLLAEVAGYTSSYTLIDCTKEGLAAFRAGSNLLAVHCRQTGGGQYIDLGLVNVR